MSDTTTESITAPSIGDAVVYVDEVGVARDAIVTNVFGEGAWVAVNVAFVSGDANREDSYGRQLERQTSVVHESTQPAHGNFWRHR